MNSKKTLVALGIAALLVGCGGGGGGGGAPTVVSNPPSAAPSITVSAMSANNVTPADCPRLQSDALSTAALDLNNANIRAINDLLQQVDATHAHKVFVRRPNDFINWIMTASGGSGQVDLVSLGAAVHETAHMVDTALYDCGPTNKHKLQFFGAQLVTDLAAGGTPNYGIVDQTIAAALKTAPRYTQYITNLGSQPGNDFRVLLDELAAYVGGAHTELQYSNTYDASAAGAVDTNLGGMVNFMVYLQEYLRAARQNNNAAWLTIQGSPATVNAIQTIWSRAEAVLQAAHSKTTAGSAPQFVVDPAYFQAAYSAALLAELDQIGVTHRSAADWSGTYLP